MGYSLRTEAQVKDTNTYKTETLALRAARELSRLTCCDVEVFNEDDNSKIAHVHHFFVDKYGHSHRQRTVMVQKED